MSHSTPWNNSPKTVSLGSGCEYHFQLAVVDGVTQHNKNREGGRQSKQERVGRWREEGGGGAAVGCMLGCCWGCEDGSYDDDDDSTFCCCVVFCVSLLPPEY